MTNYLSNSTETFLPKSIANEKETFASFWTIWHVGAGIGLLGGFLILFGACFLMIYEYFLNEKPFGSWLFLVVLPLWILGAHCFDKVEDLEKAGRRGDSKNY